ncbi:hypothetical protein GA0074694_2224 [Micromonospora inyonensis]|uniref:Uncharacterized protein n=1 Tax=Micromonospora inyonensis TaxID=47866 RepID=A0A1C6RM07_9ACTN|nr:hypothetical protein GA0074694_2224 [Micromonospora inyonensis]
MAVSYLRNTPITGKSYTTPVDATVCKHSVHAEIFSFRLVRALQPTGPGRRLVVAMPQC